MNDDKSKELQAIGRGAFECIAEMVAALECDYERLEELRDERADRARAIERAELNSDKAMCIISLADWDSEYGEELAELVKAAGECESREDAEQRIQEDPLSVEVRSGWHEIGDEPDPEEFCILLGTGGPATRIRGELDEHKQPTRAYLQAQDWFTPWTDYIAPGTRDTLLTYCQQFYFGE